jgi:uncharacterized protein with HEPN domain
MSNRHPELLINDILESGQKIITYTKFMTLRNSSQMIKQWMQ